MGWYEHMKLNKKHYILTGILLTAFLTACGGSGETVARADDSVRAAEMVAAAEAVAAVEEIRFELINEAPGIKQETGDNAVVDYSNVSDGYIMVKYTGKCEKVKLQLQGSKEKYTYNVKPGVWNAFPISEGDGEYRICLFENISGTKYAQLIAFNVDVKLKDEFAPFLRSNQYVNYAEAPACVILAKNLTEGMTDTLEKVAAVYDFTVTYMQYDKQMAQTVSTGYVPEMDTVLKKGSGICFDYAALMTGMLRSLDVPCKLVVGYVNGIYHAWITVWVEGQGWIDNVIQFNGNEWKRMDPTFASTANSKQELEEYVGDGTNYEEKYFY